MFLKWMGLAVSFTMSAASWAGDSAIEIQDQTGHKTIINPNPQRIVTLAPSLGELVSQFLEADLKRLVGVSDGTDEPSILKEKPSVGPFHKFNIEKVIALKPDLVFATRDGNPKDLVEKIRVLKIPVVVVDTQSFEQIFESIRLVGTALGNSAHANQMIGQLKKGIENLEAKSKAPDFKVQKVLLQVGHRPLVVAGSGNFLDEALTKVGAINIFHSSSQRFPRPSLEEVLRLKPDLILILAMTDAEKKNGLKLAQKEWEKLIHLGAIQKSQIRFISGDSLARPTLRLLEGLSEISQELTRGKTL